MYSAHFFVTLHLKTEILDHTYARKNIERKAVDDSGENREYGFHAVLPPVGGTGGTVCVQLSEDDAVAIQGAGALAGLYLHDSLADAAHPLLPFHAGLAFP